MMEHRFVIEARRGDSWFVVTGGDTATLAMGQFSAQNEIRDCRLVRQEDGEVVSSWSPDSRTWDPNPFARADGWQLAQAPIWDLRLHILARVPTIPVEHHVEAAALAKRVLAAADEGEIELSQFEDENILWELPVLPGEDISFRRAVHCLRLLGHLATDHPLVEDARRDLEGVTPLVSRGSAILYESSWNSDSDWIDVDVIAAGPDATISHHSSYHDREGIEDTKRWVSRMMELHPGAICLTRKPSSIPEDHVAVPPGEFRIIYMGESEVFIGSHGEEIGFSILRRVDGRWNVLDSNGASVAWGVLDLPTAMSISINHCLSGEKCFRV